LSPQNQTYMKSIKLCGSLWSYLAWGMSLCSCILCSKKNNSLTCLFDSVGLFFLCSFLRKLYPNYLECPRSYDKLRFDPRWCLNSCLLCLYATLFVAIFLNDLEWLFWLFIRLKLVAIQMRSSNWCRCGLMAFVTVAFWQY